MKMQGIQFQNLHLVDGASSNKISSVFTSKGNSFGDLMEKNLSADHSSQSNQNVKDKNVKTENGKNDLINSQNKVLKDANTEGNETVNKTTEITEISKDNLTTEQEMVSQLEEKIASIVKDTLGITDEELEELLASLGMGIMDLFMPQNLQMLVLQQGGETDVSAFLCNENLVQTMHQLQDDIQSILTEMEVTPEEIHSILDKLENPAMKETISFSNTLEHNTSKNELVGELKEDQQEEFRVIVEKEGTLNSNQQENMTDSSAEETDFVQDKTSVPKSEKQQNDKPVTASEQFVQHLVDARGSSELKVETEQAQQLREITNQILEQVKVIIKPGTTSMEFQLNPEHLGKVNFSVVAKDGQMTASFVVQNQVAKEAIEGSLQVLRENLESQGIKVDAVEVTVSNFGFDQRGFQEQNSQQDAKKKNARRIHVDQFTDSSMEEISEEELASADNLTEHGNRIDYTA